jgi:dolichol-phosphate mannosyltransferase
MNLMSPEPFSRVASGPGRVRLSVAIPCYNEEGNLHELHQRVSAVCRDEVGEDYEIILVNDGSSDGTWTIIDQLAQTDRHIIGIDLSRNFGHQAALTAGLQACSGERILILDADL